MYPTVQRQDYYYRDYIYDPLQDLTKYWSIYSDGGQCQNYTDTLLWFVSIWVMTGLWALLLGNRDLHLFLRKKWGLGNVFSSKTISCVWSCGGSSVLHIGMTIVTGYIFGGADNILNPTLAWFIRPLPTLPTVMLTTFDGGAFQQSNEEMLMTEIFYSIFPIALIGKIASLTLTLSKDASTYSGQIGSYGQSIALLQGGSAVDMLAWILNLVNLAYLVTALKQTNRAIGLVCVALRLLGGFLVWSGATLMIPSVFCPTNYMISVVTVIWGVFVPVVDHLWRAALKYEPDASPSSVLGHASSDTISHYTA
jgi:hypothetical protein